MKRLAYPILALALALAPPLAAERSIGDQLTGPFDGFVRQVVEEWRVPGLAVAIVKDGRTVFAKGYGTTRLEAGTPVDEHTLFAIGSTTKAMTAALLGTLVDDGELDFDDRVIDHLPGFRLHDPWMTREVTVRDLLTHRAGLGNADFLWYGSDRSRDEILARLALVEPAYSMRDGFIYQNIMYIAAGEVAAAIGGSSWENLMVRRLFDPLGMTRTRPTLAGAQKMSNVAAPHFDLDGTIETIDNASVDSAGPAGSVWSSVSDMSRWIRALLAEGAWGEGRVLSPEVVAELLEPQLVMDVAAFYPAVRLIDPHWTTYALGWFQVDYRGRAISFHTGSIDGMSAIVGLVPEEELGVVVLQNLDHAECRHALLWKAIDLWTGVRDGRDWNGELGKLYEEATAQAAEALAERRAARHADTRPSLSLEAYTGTYAHPVYDRASVEYRDGWLHLEIGPQLRGRLDHWHHDTFTLTFDRDWQGTTPVTFVLGRDGEPARLEALGITWSRASERP